ncbi:hypothetical protein LSH36_60g06037 [Paralvinella palmiformis]|uniref:Uncharacterized protein n=1 Tax=Paralvinella palmiformis TaxID=53620 RepID=A0AAD9K537_9ANNE|nr:hypothetical protein LSH36_60g06037 [Paralvinella palmiformis]
MDTHIVKTSTNYKNDLEVGKLFYTCNILFNVAEHSQFKKVMNMLRNGYQSPSRKQIAGNLLDSVYDQLQSDMKKLIDCKTGTLVQDGWSNIHNEPIIASSLQVEGKSYLLDSHPTGSMAKTGENCKTLCEESIQKAKDTYNCSVSGICTDNAKNMEWMRADLQQDDPDLSVWLLCSLAELVGSRLHYTICHEAHYRSAKKIQDINIFRNAKDMADQLRPVANAIDCCQADNASLAAACDTWLSVLDHPKLQSPALKHIVVKCLKQAIILKHDDVTNQNKLAVLCIVGFIGGPLSDNTGIFPPF